MGPPWSIDMTDRRDVDEALRGISACHGHRVTVRTLVDYAGINPIVLADRDFTFNSLPAGLLEPADYRAVMGECLLQWGSDLFDKWGSPIEDIPAARATATHCYELQKKADLDPEVIAHRLVCNCNPAPTPEQLVEREAGFQAYLRRLDEREARSPGATFCVMPIKIPAPVCSGGRLITQLKVDANAYPSQKQINHPL